PLPSTSYCAGLVRAVAAVRPAHTGIVVRIALDAIAIAVRTTRVLGKRFLDRRTALEEKLVIGRRRVDGAAVLGFDSALPDIVVVVAVLNAAVGRPVRTRRLHVWIDLRHGRHGQKHGE